MLLGHYDRTGEIPKILEEQPILNRYLAEYFSHFCKLSRCRTVGMSANPLQISEIESYIRIFGIDEEEIETFVFLMMELDSVFLDHLRKKNK